MITQEVVKLGPDGRLVGIVTTPDTPRRRACVLVSAGLIPKFGPFRLYTHLARRLARDGFTTLRFDLGGIGDSAVSTTSRPLAERTGAEIASAVAHLKAHGELDALVVGGLCSGAEDAFRYAETDPSVTGVVLLDPFAYRTAGWNARHLAYRAMRRALRALGIYQPIPIDSSSRLVDYEYMAQVDSSRILRAMIARRAHVHFVYTGGMHHAFNHPSQLAAMYPGLDFAGQISLDHFPHTDHTQLFQEDRDRLVDAIGARLASW